MRTPSIETHPYIDGWSREAMTDEEERMHIVARALKGERVVFSRTCESPQQTPKPVHMWTWICESCEHEVIAAERPAPIKWSDGHECYFVRENSNEDTRAS